jgi:hypothetical protein
VESVVPIRPWFSGNVDHRRIDMQTHWNGSLPKSAKMRLTKFVPIGRLWKRIGQVLNGNSKKGSSWIWSKMDSRNVRFGSSCPSAIQRSVDCIRFCKMVSTCFRSIIHRAFMLMHFMIMTWTQSR